MNTFKAGLDSGRVCEVGGCLVFGPDSEQEWHSQQLFVYHVQIFDILHVDLTETTPSSQYKLMAIQISTG